jgi:hypothetical protein
MIYFLSSRTIESCSHIKLLQYTHHFRHCVQMNTLYSYDSKWLPYSTYGLLTLVEQELPTLPEHLSSPPIFSWVRVTRSLVLCVCFVDCCLSFYTFSFGHCVVCSSSIYGSYYPFGIFKLFLVISWRSDFFST